ncbi:hypothetical protein [Chitinophaga cymbidii]|nr:hypothetical protein [Chitinophaga cymbidii]
MPRRSCNLRGFCRVGLHRFDSHQIAANVPVVQRVGSSPNEFRNSSN